jgi:hypothetical protein
MIDLTKSVSLCVLKRDIERALKKELAGLGMGSCRRRSELS